MLSAALLVARRQAHSKSHRKSNIHSGNQHGHVALQELLGAPKGRKVILGNTHVHFWPSSGVHKSDRHVNIHSGNQHGRVALQELLGAPKGRKVILGIAQLQLEPSAEVSQSYM